MTTIEGLLGTKVGVAVETAAASPRRQDVCVTSWGRTPGTAGTMAHLSPEQARELASTLVAQADAVDGGGE